MKEKVLIQTNSKNLLYFAIGALFAGFVITLIIGAALGGVSDVFEFDYGFGPFILMILGVIASIILFLNIGSITITNKRIYKSSLFKTIKVLPLDKVCCYGTSGFFHSVMIKAASGKVSVLFAKNYNEIQSILDELLIGSEIITNEE